MAAVRQMSPNESFRLAWAIVAHFFLSFVFSLYLLLIYNLRSLLVSKRVAALSKMGLNESKRLVQTLMCFFLVVK